MGYIEIGTIEPHGTVYAYEPDPKVLGGYYLGGNADVRPNTSGMNLGSVTQYRSLADGNTFPGWTKGYLVDLHDAGVLLNYVLELKHYGAARGIQNFTVEGANYSVPDANMVTQRRSSTEYAISYGYGQLLSGSLNGLLHRAAYQIKTNFGLDADFNIQIASEFDTDHEFGIKEGSTVKTREAADALGVEAVKYIVDYFKDYGLINLTFSVGMGGFDRPSWLRMHPVELAEWVDFLQYNVYRRVSTDTAYGRFNRTKAWSDADLDPAWTSKNIIVAEWGTPADLGSQSEWIWTVPDAVTQINEESQTGLIVVTNYFDSNPAWATLNPRDAGLAALRDIYSGAPYDWQNA